MPVYIKAMADYFEEAELFLAGLTIGGNNITTDRVGSLIEPDRHLGADKLNGVFPPGIVIEQLGAERVALGRPSSLNPSTTGRVRTISPINCNSESVMPRSAADASAIA